MQKGCNSLLTKREFEVLQLVTDGFSNSIISQKLHISEATTKAHIGHIFEKLKVQNRIQAVIKAFRQKIV